MYRSYQEFLAHGHGKHGPWLDLLNSQEWDTFGHLTEHIDNPAWLRFFLRRWGFAKPQRPFPAAEWTALRATLRSICERAGKTRSVSPADLRALNQALNVAGTLQLRENQNGLKLEFVPA